MLRSRFRNIARMKRSKRRHASGSRSISEVLCLRAGFNLVMSKKPPAKPYTIRLDLPLSDDHYKAIGRVAANWSMIESSLVRDVHSNMLFAWPARRTF